ncbi:hypothetical protein GW17_00027322 [Ensete ventricosum]|uniref:Uncharacterized protein n=1 Tax=Ensete ventricosum TaxID=4639 RepID=A0A426YKY0_ENSVE|nr:hypothetical protein B296_00050499 [Ensete ventricosum]RWW09200.1 hypothetical protein GW17_00027322 [Ensete ventricosum]
MVNSPVVNMYPLSNYTFGTKEPKMEKDTSVADRLARMKVNYMKEGMRTSVDGILLVTIHTYLERTVCSCVSENDLNPSSYSLVCLAILTEIEGLRRKLCSKLAANSTSFQPDWQVFHWI